MAHEIFGERFFGRRVPAWHRIGTVLDQGLSARAALDLVGEYWVDLQDLRTVRGVDVPLKAIVRYPTEDDPVHKIFGVVGPDYTLITPHDFCAIWDEHVGEPVETLGALKEGRILFVSAILPSFKVRGDEVANYLLAVGPMTGDEAAEVRVTPVRVVCNNTLIASARMASETYRIVHDQTAKERLGRWLTYVWQRVEAMSKKLQKAFDAMAACNLSGGEHESLIPKLYPYPNYPSENALPEVARDRVERWQQMMKTVDLRRWALRELLAGAGTGLDQPACRGTAWGLYNAVAELEDYRYYRQDKSAAFDAIYGDRARVKERAFEMCLSVCH